MAAGETRLIGIYESSSKANNGDKVSKKRFEKATNQWKHNLIEQILQRKQNSPNEMDVDAQETDDADDADQMPITSENVEELLESAFDFENYF